MLASTEECAAKATLAATSGSVAAYDKVPLAAASCLFTMDTSSNILLLHSFQVQMLALCIKLFVCPRFTGLLFAFICVFFLYCWAEITSSVLYMRVLADNSMRILTTL